MGCAQATLEPPTLLTSKNVPTKHQRTPVAWHCHSTTTALWSMAVQKYGQMPAVTFTGNGDEMQFTYAELESRSNRLARYLQQQYGVVKADRLVTVARNRPELITLFLACQKLAAIFVPLAPELSRDDLEMLVARYNGKLVLVDDDVKSFGPTTVKAMALGSAEEVGDDSALPRVARPEDTAIMFSTSGTTSAPKGVMWSHRSLSHICPEFQRGEITGERQLLWVPLRGIATPLLMLHGFHRGTHSIFVDHFPSTPKTWGDILESHSIDSMLLFGGAMAGMLQAHPGRIFEKVRQVAYGGSPTPPVLAQQSMKQFPNAKFWKCWGMTELGFGTLLRPEQHVEPEAAKNLLEVMESCGPPTTGVECKIENPNEHGHGQLLCASPTMMQGYYMNAKKTTEDLPDGFLRTGDLARMDENGNVYIIDRIKDVVVTEMGQNIAPIDIEKVLLRHPAVGEAGVVGIQHPSKSGEMIVAWISVKAGHELEVGDIKAFVDTSGLAPWQLPKVYEITKKPLPKPSGKISKKTLRSPTFVRQNLSEQIKEVMSQKPSTSEKSSWQDKADAVFDRIDFEHLGFLGRESMSHVVGDGQAEDTLKAMDANNKGRVTREEFHDFLCRPNSAQRDQILLTIESALASWELEHP